MPLNVAVLQDRPCEFRELHAGTPLAWNEGSTEGLRMLSTNQWIALLGVALTLFAIACFVIFARSARRRHAELRRRFGPEYEHEVEQRGSVSRAERELLAREKRLRKRQLHPLSEDDRTRFSTDWHNVQAGFVDHPSGAVQAADELIKAVMLAQGYDDVESFDQRVADLSVEHAGVVRHYRSAHELAVANREGRSDTEELRRAMVYYRALFADLLAEPVRDDVRVVPPPVPTRQHVLSQ
jgi:hypothetical protein